MVEGTQFQPKLRPRIPSFPERAFFTKLLFCDAKFLSHPRIFSGISLSWIRVFPGKIICKKMISHHCKGIIGLSRKYIKWKIFYLWVGSMSREWLALVEKNENENFFTKPFFVLSASSFHCDNIHSIEYCSINNCSSIYLSIFFLLFIIFVFSSKIITITFVI